MKNLTAPLSDLEIDRLTTFLARVVGGDIPNVEAFDGFITALAVCPEMIPPSEFLPVVQSGASEDGDLVFDRHGLSWKLARIKVPMDLFDKKE